MREQIPLFPWILSGVISLAPLSSLMADYTFSESDRPDQSFPQSTPIDSTLPWLTGPLIAPTGTAIPKGHYDIQSYNYLLVNTGIYNHHWHARSTPNFYNVTLQVQAIVGITPWMDFQINPLALYNTTKGHSSTHFGDLPLGFDFQLLSTEKYKWFPGIKLGIMETFPTGKYQKLSPKKLDTEVSGFGSFATAIGLVFYKVYHLGGLHFLSMTASFEPTFHSPVHVRGHNAYGGAPNTLGTVYPGISYSAILSFEYTFNKNWVFALDNVYLHNNKDRFSGHRGSLASGVPAVVRRPSSEQLSFAPAIEYNFSSHWGIITGAWFSAAGRNSLMFRGGIFSFVYSH